MTMDGRRGWMKWSTPMVVLVVLTSGVATEPLNKDGTKDDVPPQDGCLNIDVSNWTFPEPRGSITHVRIKCLPVAPEMMMTFKVEVPEFRSDDILWMMIHGDNTTGQGTDDYSYFYYHMAPTQEYSDVILWSPDGDRRGSILSDDYVNLTVAYQIALDFIALHGGMPPDAQIVSATPKPLWLERGEVFDPHVNGSYTFIWRRFIDGVYPIIGWDELMKITISNIGQVIHFYKQWLTPYQKVERFHGIHSSYEALLAIKNNPFMCGCDKHTVTEAILGYMHPPPFRFNKEYEIYPVWLFRLEDSDAFIVIDAFTLEEDGTTYP